MQQSFRNVILGQFDTDIAIQLIEFGNSLSQIDADILIFMARKSPCLYDMLVQLGITPVERCFVSDRILDMRLDPLNNKRIALVDDTLILGTTLAKTKRKLEQEANAKISVHVFCADDKWWRRDLIRPDNRPVLLDDSRMITFCTSEVRALSLIPRPYIVDFPISQPMRVLAKDSQCLLSSVEWVSYRISTEIQERNNVSVFTFFPTDSIISEWSKSLPKSIIACLDIVKVRAFARKQDNIYWIQLVPIATLNTLSESDIDLLFHMVTDTISIESGQDLKKLLEYANSLSSKQRFVQYVLSAALGERFMQSMRSSIGTSLATGYDSNETDRHYGPWLHDTMEVVVKNAYKALWSPDKNVDMPKIYISPAKLPENVDNLVSATLLNSKLNQSDMYRDDRDDGSEEINLLTEFAEIFLNLYDTKEVPARQEVHRLGKGILDTSDAPLRDRLEIGIPWALLAQHIIKKHNLPASRTVFELLSLSLDLCNDLGIAVPVTCAREGVVFRAYRHGEDVKFTDGELALAYETVKGFLDGTNQATISHLHLEKLLILMIKIGVAKRFLEPLYGSSGVQGVAKVAFDLKGAIPVVSLGPKDKADRNLWLSKYLVERGILNQEQPDGPYLLGKTIIGSFRTPDAPDEAYEMGNIIGMLMRKLTDPTARDAPLDDNSLTILATCYPPRHAAAALQVELDIFVKSWRKYRNLLNKINWSSRSLSE